MCEGYRGTILTTHRLEITLVLRGKTERPVPGNSEVIKTNPSELRRHRVKAATAVPLCSLHPNLRNAAGGHAPPWSPWSVSARFQACFPGRQGCLDQSLCPVLTWIFPPGGRTQLKPAPTCSSTCPQPRFQYNGCHYHAEPVPLSLSLMTGKHSHVLVTEEME